MCSFISINGSEARLPNDPRVSLLDYLREHLGLHGTKKGCNQTLVRPTEHEV
jgi:xanthine dehydrogenase YagT iron-sulfur-binding subunit